MSKRTTIQKNPQLGSKNILMKKKRKKPSTRQKNEEI